MRYNEIKRNFNFWGHIYCLRLWPNVHALKPDNFMLATGFLIIIFLKKKVLFSLFFYKRQFIICLIPCTLQIEAHLLTCYVIVT